MLTAIVILRSKNITYFNLFCCSETELQGLTFPLGWLQTIPSSFSHSEHPSIIGEVLQPIGAMINSKQAGSVACPVTIVPGVKAARMNGLFVLVEETAGFQCFSWWFLTCHPVVFLLSLNAPGHSSIIKGCTMCSYRCYPVALPGWPSSCSSRSASFPMFSRKSCAGSCGPAPQRESRYPAAPAGAWAPQLPRSRAGYGHYQG